MNFEPNIYEDNSDGGESYAGLDSIKLGVSGIIILLYIYNIT